MNFLIELWLPILLSAVGIFVASSVLHMVIQFHRRDYDKLPDEESLVETLTRAKLPPGNYVVPHCDSFKEMATPEFMAKYERGPVGFLTLVANRPPPMGKILAQWFAYALLMSTLVAYVARLGLDASAEPMQIFRMTSALTFITYGLGSVPESIWMGKKWSTALRYSVDGLVFALIVGACFTWLWPSA